MRVDLKKATIYSLENLMSYWDFLFIFKLYHVRDQNFNSPENTYLVTGKKKKKVSSLNVRVRSGSHCVHISCFKQIKLAKPWGRFLQRQKYIIENILFLNKMPDMGINVLFMYM